MPRLIVLVFILAATNPRIVCSLLCYAVDKSLDKCAHANLRAALSITVKEQPTVEQASGHVSAWQKKATTCCRICQKQREMGKSCYGFNVRRNNQTCEFFYFLPIYSFSTDPNCFYIKAVEDGQFSDPKCPVGFTQSSNSCYKMITVSETWSNAQAKCSNLYQNAHLLMIETSEEDSIVSSIYRSSPCPDVRIFMGGQKKDRTSVTTLVWRPLPGYEIPIERNANWNVNVGQPNSDAELCLAFNGDTPNVAWHDMSCEVSLCYICEYNL